jgi:hypothetical protein
MIRKASLVVLCFSILAAGPARSAEQVTGTFSELELGLDRFDDALVDRTLELIRIRTYGIQAARTSFEFPPGFSRGEIAAFLLHVTMGVRPRLRVVNHLGVVVTVPPLEETLSNEEAAKIVAGADPAARMTALRSAARYQKARTWEKRAMERSLQMDERIFRFVRGSVLWQELDPTPCGEDCEALRQRLEARKPPGSYLRFVVEGQTLRTFYPHTLTDLDPNGFQRTPERGTPELSKIGPGLFYWLSDRLTWMPLGLGDEVAATARLAAKPMDEFLTNEEIRTLAGIAGIPGLEIYLRRMEARRRAIAQATRGSDASYNQAVRELEEAVRAARANRAADQTRIEKLLAVVRRDRGWSGWMRSLFRLRRDPSSVDDAGQALKVLKGKSVDRVPFLERRVLSRIGRWAVAAVVAVDVADALISLGEPRDQLARKVGRIVADAALGGGILALSTALPVIGLASTAAMLAAEGARAFVHPDVPTLEDATDLVAEHVADGLLMQQRVLRRIRGRGSVLQDDWARLREEGYRKIRMIDPEWEPTADGKPASHEPPMQEYAFTGAAYLDLVTRYKSYQHTPKVEDRWMVIDRITRKYAEKYIGLLFDTARLAGDRNPNRLAQPLPIAGLHVLTLPIAWWDDREQEQERRVVQSELRLDLEGFLRDARALAPTEAEIEKQNSGENHRFSGLSEENMQRPFACRGSHDEIPGTVARMHFEVNPLGRLDETRELAAVVRQGGARDAPDPEEAVAQYDMGGRVEIEVTSEHPDAVGILRLFPSVPLDYGYFGDSMKQSWAASYCDVYAEPVSRDSSKPAATTWCYPASLVCSGPDVYP